MKFIIHILFLASIAIINANAQDIKGGSDMTQKILILVTNHDKLAGEANGTYTPELTHALHALKEAGYGYDLVSIRGGKAPIYGAEADDTINAQMFADGSLSAALDNTKTISEIKADDYIAVFYPGGFGLLHDLHENTEAAAITASIYDNGGVVGAVCHGPAGLLPVTLKDGSSILEGKSVTAFTRDEEVAYGTISKIPFVLEEALLSKAGKFIKVAPWGEHVITDGRLITGQNPASAHGVGAAMVKVLSAVPVN